MSNQRIVERNLDQLDITTLRYMSAAAVAFVAIGVATSLNSGIVSVIGRIFGLQASYLDYLYLVTFLVLLTVGIFWMLFGNQENNRLVYWVTPKFFVIEHGPVHIAILACIALLFLLLFIFVPNFLAFIILFALYEFFDVLQWIFKRMDLQRLLADYLKELETERSRVQSDDVAVKIIDIKLSALDVLRNYNFELPMIKLHLFLLSVALALAGVAIFIRLTTDTEFNSKLSHPKIIVAAYAILLLAIVIHETIIWRWRDEMFSKLEPLRRDLVALSASTPLRQ